MSNITRYTGSLEASPFIGLGRNKYTDVGGNQDGTDASGYGPFIETGIRAGAYYTFDSNAQVGLTVGYVNITSRATINYNSDAASTPGSSATDHLSGYAHGMLIGLCLGYRF